MYRLITKETVKDHLNGDELWVIYDNCSWPVCSVNEIDNLIKHANDMNYNVTNIKDIIDIVKYTIKSHIDRDFDLTNEYMNKIYFEMRPKFTSANFVIISPVYDMIGTTSDLEDLLIFVFAAETSCENDDFRTKYISSDNKFLLKAGLYPIFDVIQDYIYEARCLGYKC